MSHFSSYRIQEHQPKIALSTVTELQCPVLRSSALQGEPEAACSAPELLDWLGAVFSHTELCVAAPGWRARALAGFFFFTVAYTLKTNHTAEVNIFSFFSFCGCVWDRNNEPHNFISTYCCPQPSTVVAKAYLCTITGFILPEKICLLLEQLRWECFLPFISWLSVPTWHFRGGATVPSSVVSHTYPLFPCLGSQCGNIIILNDVIILGDRNMLLPSTCPYEKTVSRV